MMQPLTVAAAQIECRPGDVDANLALHLDAIAEAQRQGAALLLFPELSLTDYLAAPDVAGLARPEDDPALQRIAEAAGTLLVSVGFIERGADGRAYNAQALLGGGQLLQVHRKLNLPTYGRLAEGRHYAAGDAIRPLTAGGWRIATLICADSWNPALTWLAALQGTELLLQPIASARDAVDPAFDNPGGWDLALRHAALTYGLPTVMANHCGRRDGFDFWGGSRILDPFGRILAMAGEAPGLVVATLDPGDVATARRRLPTMRDADPVLVHRLLERLLAKGPAP